MSQDSHNKHQILLSNQLQHLSEAVTCPYPAFCTYTAQQYTNLTYNCQVKLTC